MGIAAEIAPSGLAVHASDRRSSRSGRVGEANHTETLAASAEGVTNAEIVVRSQPSRLVPGQSVGRYTLMRQVGSGAMGVVFEAYDPELDRRLAIKVVKMRGDARQRANASTRMIREAQALARLTHPNVVAIHDFGRIDGDVYVVMDFIEGLTLREWLARATRSFEEIRRVFIQAGEGLAAAHAANLIHRDFKPDNVLVGHDGRVVVVDFGLARAAASGQTTSKHGWSSSQASSDSHAPISGPSAAGTQTSRVSTRGSTISDSQRHAQARPLHPVDLRSVTEIGEDAAREMDVSADPAEARAGTQEDDTAASGQHLVDARVGPAASSSSSGTVPDFADERDGLRGASSTALSDQITRHGAIVGTPAYMAPEQHLGERADTASDQFSYCVALYEAAYGQGPFAGESAAVRAMRVLQGDLRPPPRTHDAPRWLWPLLRRGLALQPQDRFPSMDALLHELRKDRRAGWQGLVFLGVVALAILPWIWAGTATRGTTCPSRSARAEAIWNQEHANSVAREWADSGLPYARESARLVGEKLDAWREEWTGSFASACGDAEGKGETSSQAYTRIACLERRLVEFESTVEIVRSSEGAASIDRMVDLVDGLHPPSSCADPAAYSDELATLGAAAGTPQAEAAERMFIEAQAHVRLANYERARVVATESIQLAEEVSAPSLRARGYLARAMALEGSGDLVAAEADLLTAVADAERAGDARVLTRVRERLGLVVGDRLQRIREGSTWLELARVSLERVGDDPEIEAAIELTTAFVASHKGEHLAELAAIERALELQQRVVPRSLLRESTTRMNLAATLAQLGRYDDGEREAQAALAALQDELGPAHPQIASAYATLALVSDYRGDNKAAIERGERALALMKDARLDEHPTGLTIRQNLAIAYAGDDRMEESEAEFRELVKIRERRPDESMALAGTLQNLSAVLRVRGKQDEAIALIERSVALRAKEVGEDDPSMAVGLASLANSYDDLQRYEESAAMRRRVVELNERAFGRDHPDLAIDHGNLAWTLLKIGEKDEALKAAERAVEIITGREAKPDVKAFAHVVLATVLFEMDASSQRARDEAARTAEILALDPSSGEQELLDELKARPGWSP